MALPIATHSKLSFSSRARWSVCPVSVPLSVGIEDKSSPAAAEGALAHSVAEHYVRQHFALTNAADGDPPLYEFPDNFDAKGRTCEVWNEELRRAGRGYRDYIIELIGDNEPSAYISLEHKVCVSSIHSELVGTGDCLIWLAVLKILIVLDYKYGFADVDVGTLDNPNKQIEAYAIAAIETANIEPERIVLAIYQPRRHIGSAGATLELPGSWLPAARAKLAQEAQAVDAAIAQLPNAQINYVAGEHCRYCRAKTKCGAPNNFAVAALKQYANPLTLSDMTDSEVIGLWSLRIAFKNFMEDIDERIKQLSKNGHAGLTLKETQGRQMWIDSRDAALTLLTLGRTDMLQAVALSEAIHAIPKTYRDSLVKRSAPSHSIVAVTKADAGDVMKCFQKYANIS